MPTEFGIMGRLRGLQLHSNELTGPIPSELGLLSGEFGKIILLFQNRLTEPIPWTLANMKSMSGLALSGNQLSGPIPLELLMSYAGVAGMNFSNNPGLTGTVPESFCDATEAFCSIGSPPCHPAMRTCGYEYFEFYYKGYTGCNLAFDCNDGQVCGCHCNCSTI